MRTESALHVSGPFPLLHDSNSRRRRMQYDRSATMPLPIGIVSLRKDTSDSIEAKVGGQELFMDADGSGPRDARKSVPHAPRLANRPRFFSKPVALLQSSVKESEI